MLAALRNGHLSLRKADQLLYMPAEEQHALLAAKADESHKYQLAAHTIEGYLERHTGERIDLAELAAQLRAAVLPAGRV
jgi:hypothetical protein